MENKKLIIFCTSHKTINYLDKFYPFIQMVGCGNTVAFPNSWHKSNEKKIFQKNFLVTLI
jgi:hypothetical protein